MNNFYDGTKLLSYTDIDGNKPEIYLCTTNRSAGKTTFFSRYFVKRFLQNAEKFCIIYRYKYELDGCAEKFFKDINTLFFNGLIMTSKSHAKGIYHEMLLDNVSCGYAIAINSAEQLKKYSHVFSDVTRMLFDEFQSESNNYCPNEIKKFISIHTTIARGGGKQYRYVPVIMLGNPVSILNPYYIELGISDRINDKTKFLRGKGFVLEHGFLESASNAQKQSGFNKAFSNNSYVDYSINSTYLNDNNNFIEKPSGESRYLVTIKYLGQEYSIKEFPEQGFLYCDTSVDYTFPNRISITTDDHDVNYVMLKRNDLFITNLRWFFEHGCFRFKNAQCKQAALKLLSY